MTTFFSGSSVVGIQNDNKFSDGQLFFFFSWVCFLEEILEFYGRLGGWSMSIARWPMADILVQRLKLELRVLDNGYAAADYFWMGSLSPRLDQGHHRRYEMHTWVVCRAVFKGYNIGELLGGTVHV